MGLESSVIKLQNMHAIALAYCLQSPKMVL